MWKAFLGELDPKTLLDHIQPYSKFCASSDRERIIDMFLSRLCSLTNHIHSVANNIALLGPIGVGKTMILKLFAFFCVSKLSTFRPLYVSYQDACQIPLPLDLFKETWGYPPDISEDASYHEYFAGWRANHQYPIFLLDEFQMVYSNPDHHILLDQVSDLMSQGMPFFLSFLTLLGLVVVSGSSSRLPDLLYRPPVDLNQGKLQRQRLSCIDNLDTFREFIRLLYVFH